MTVEEIIQSGLIELYVLGALSEQEARKVEGFIDAYPSVAKEYKEIQLATLAYAKHQAIIPRASLENSIKDLIKKEGSKVKFDKVVSEKLNTPSNKSNYWLLGLFGLLAAGALYFGFHKDAVYKDLQNRYDKLENDCTTERDNLNEEIDEYKTIYDQSTKTIPLTPTDGFKETNLFFHINDDKQSNFIQVKNLPTIASNETFQLWSLKEGQNPIPLTIFQSGEDLIIPVDFESGTGTYAITIEPAGGSQSPNLANLIGTATLS